MAHSLPDPHKKKIQLLLAVLFSALIILGGIIFFWRYQESIAGWIESWQQSYLSKETPPEATWKPENTNINLNTNSSTGSGVVLVADAPSQHNLKMEFHSQAPLLNWDLFHEEMCEEASVLLVINYFEGTSMTNDEFDEKLYDMQQQEEIILNVWESTTVAELKKFIESYFTDYKVIIVENITSEEIERYIASNIPVLLPMSGQTIGNPFYKAPGPVYHVLVVKGYTTTHFITNDVGTKRGKDYFYKKNTIMNNIHDWNATNIFKGAKRGFVIVPK